MCAPDLTDSGINGGGSGSGSSIESFAILYVLLLGFNSWYIRIISVIMLCSAVLVLKKNLCSGLVARVACF